MNGGTEKGGAGQVVKEVWVEWTRSRIPFRGLPQGFNLDYRHFLNLVLKTFMLSKKTIFVVSIVCLSALHHHVADAQFGVLFRGGQEIATIETDALAKMIRERHEAEGKAKESGTDLPPAIFVVVDVRSDAEIGVSVIPGAITKAQFEKDRQVYANRLVIPYCTVGGRSRAYAKQLSADDVKVQNYKGSILEWVDAGLPLVTLDGEPTNRVHTYSDRYRIPPQYKQVTE